MKIETKLNLQDKIYLAGIQEHFGHVEAIINAIHILDEGVQYEWEQYIVKDGENKLFDSGTFMESEIGDTIYQTLSEWAFVAKDELDSLGITSDLSKE